MSFENEINTLFQAGLKLFNDKNFYDAHEKWEDLWSDYYLKDRLFIQGLIQLSVSFVHLKNNNMNATIGYFIGFALGCIAMFIAIKLNFSSIAKMILIFSRLIGSVIISWVGDEK